MSSTMYTIRLFAGLAERLGAPELRLDASSAGVSGGELKRRLADLYPQHAALIASCFLARNQAYARDEERVQPSDELALIPPVSGGSGAAEAEAPLYRIVREPLDIAGVASLVADDGHGANLVFVGTTRALTYGRRTLRLDYDAYEPMAVRTMAQIGGEIAERWSGARCAIAHRIGTVPVGDASVVIAVSAPHRVACYEASRYAIERLKQIVPIWKKEIWEDGEEWLGHQLGPWDPTAPAGPSSNGGPHHES